MTQELFGDRRRALEEEFFRKYNDRLVADMRARIEREGHAALLAGTTGITDEHLIAQLLKEGLTPATFTAVALVPLVAVAWADGKLEEPERLRILRDPQTQALNPDARALLTNWLIEAPEPALFDSWCEYVRALWPTLEAEARSSLRDSTINRARAVAAAAAGEPYGMGRAVSREESAVLARIEAAFTT
ncbi:MAG TPA: hypothetical protein PKD27_04100 [Tepidiformaceae bacterium]|nr:hypothetical protein [Tepidiformaceae bacterium]